MFATIIEASENFCTHQVRKAYITEKIPTKNRTLIAYIDITTNDKNSHRVYIASDYAFMQLIAKLFLEEEQSDDETLTDMTLETSNLIIGSAKVISESSNEPYSINTPHFVKAGNFDLPYDECITIKIKDSEITIAIKDLNGL